MIGINTAIRADAEGIAFAIPIERAKAIKDRLKAFLVPKLAFRCGLKKWRNTFWFHKCHLTYGSLIFSEVRKIRVVRELVPLKEV